MVKRIQVDMSNKSFYSLIVIGILVLLGSVYAYGTSNPSVMGHSAEELEVDDAFCNKITGHDCGVDESNTGKILDITIYKDCTRRPLSTATSFILASFTVNKLSATSTLLCQGSISGQGDYSGHLQQGWKIGSGTETLGQSISYGSYSRIYSTTAVIEGHTTTGSQTMVFRYFSNSGSAEKPFNVYNPSSFDNARLRQTCSVYTVWEIEQ